MEVVINDGGRAAAGYTGEAGDCVCRSIAIVAGVPYQEVYEALNALAERERPRKRLGGRNGVRSSARNGVHKRTAAKYLAALGFTWVPTMGIGTGCTVHLRADELPPGRIVVSVSRHITAVIDGVIHDTHNPARDGVRCVYGYWHRAS